MADVGVNVPRVRLQHDLGANAVGLDITSRREACHPVVHRLVHGQPGEQKPGCGGPNHIRHGRPDILGLHQVRRHLTTPIGRLRVPQVQHPTVRWKRLPSALEGSCELHCGCRIILQDEQGAVAAVTCVLQAMAPCPDVGRRTPTLAGAQLQLPFLIGVQVVPALPHRARLLVHDVASSVPRVCHLVCTDLSGTAVCRGKVLESKFRAPGCKPRCASIHPVGPALEIDHDRRDARQGAGWLRQSGQRLALPQRPRDALGSIPAEAPLCHMLRHNSLVFRRNGGSHSKADDA
mmetsp:Transcript_34814/g.100041  ORF Transcript_34814/g.100041 Transcript_34814/m.100041 type:complete len:291 (-) Transcript_34814:43-915(-)